MATMVTSTKSLPKKGAGSGAKPPGPNGNGWHHKNGSAGYANDPSASRYRIGMWVALASILMMFTALSSAYIVRAASAPDWVTLQIPRVLWLSTALIVLSSVTIEYSKRSLKQSLNASYLRWLAATSLLGAAFLAAQLMAWRQFVRQGLYVASNPHSSFFYLLTATHGLHLIGGLLALIYLLVRSRRPRTDELAEARRVAAVDAVTVYWHFLDVLWLYLFGLLFFWR